MKIFFISDNIPYKGMASSHKSAWAWVDSFSRNGHEVVLMVDPPSSDISRKKQLKLMKDINFNNCKIISIYKKSNKKIKNRSFLNRLLNPQIKEFYSMCEHKEVILEIIKKNIDLERPDILFLYGFPIVYIASEIKEIPKVAPICEDPYDLYKYYFFEEIWKLNLSFFKRIIKLYKCYRIVKKSLKFFKKCEIHGQITKRYVENFKRYGAPDTKLVFQPVLDHKFRELRKIKRKYQNNNEKFKIILIGNLSSRGRAQYNYLYKKILPDLEKKIDIEKIEIHLIGSEYNSDFKGLYEKKYIMFRGYVQDIEVEYLSSNLIIMPSPAKIGGRVSIAEAMSFGCCILTTIHELGTLPHLHPNKNILVAKNHSEFSLMLSKIINKEIIISSIEDNARNTFVNHFESNTVCNKYLKLFKKLKND